MGRNLNVWAKLGSSPVCRWKRGGGERWIKGKKEGPLFWKTKLARGVG